jgi:glycosyltransferase involved in cell wall biosynthesis
MIVSATGDLPTLVQRFNLGYVIPPDDPVKLKQALEAFIRARYSRTQVLPSFDEAKALFNLSRATADFLCQAGKIVHRPCPISFP